MVSNWTFFPSSASGTQPDAVSVVGHDLDDVKRLVDSHL